MRVILAYTRVVRPARENPKAASNYDPAFERFLRTYKQFRPTQEHELVIIDCGGGGPPVWLYDDPQIPARSIEYYGDGWDVGAAQYAAHALECDLLVCLNSWTYFAQENWLYPIVSAARHYGPGLYGPSSSNELGPHIRTPCMAVDPKLLREFPIAVNNRDRCCAFEAGPESFTKFVLRRKLPVLLVLKDQVRPPETWRAPELQNIFRRGNQSNCLVRDRHIDFFANAHPLQKEVLSAYADGPTQ